MAFDIGLNRILCSKRKKIMNNVNVNIYLRNVRGVLTGAYKAFYLILG